MKKSGSQWNNAISLEEKMESEEQFRKFNGFYPVYYIGDNSSYTETLKALGKNGFVRLKTDN